MSKVGASLATCYGPVSTQVMAKAEKIKLLILDVDGVLSDGSKDGEIMGISSLSILLFLTSVIT